MASCSVYILQSLKSDHYYIGESSDVIKRLKEHNAGLVKSTKNGRPWELKFAKEYASSKIAKQVEYKLKKMKRRDIIERIIFEKEIKIKVDD